MFPQLSLLSISRIKRYLHLPRKKRSRALVYGGALLGLFVYIFFIGAPFGFPGGSLITIQKGVTLTEAAEFLEGENVIQSPFLFKGLVLVLKGEDGVQSGDYYFPSSQNIFHVAWRLTHGWHGLDLIRVTLPEGASAEEMASILKKKFPDFDVEQFLRLAVGDEGYLFPDTYFFLPNVEARIAYLALRNNFKLKIRELEEDILKSGHSTHEIVTMAALLEKEAFTYEDMRTIAGILWKRLSIGMALQVDATFLYINGKTTFDLTLDDLRENESLYNTYKYRGLPPGPITNPGLLAIQAALRPHETPYLFYLSDLSSNLHFSRTFEEHKLKKARYLP